MIFEAVLGLHVNWSKSMLFPVKEVANIQVLAAIFGCEVGSLRTIYLGSPHGHK